MKVTCPQCGVIADLMTGAVNRARKIGAPVYCGRACAGLARRRGKTAAQRKTEKRFYDQRYRAANPEKRKIEKKAYHKRTYDPTKAAVERKAKMPSHIEYCRRPEYRAWKREYDQKYRADKEYGPFADAFLTLLAVEREVATRMSNYEIRTANGTLNKRTQRKREYERQTGLPG